MCGEYTSLWGDDYDIKNYQAALLMYEIQSYLNGKKLPLIVCGDFNSSPDGSTYKYLTGMRTLPIRRDVGRFMDTSRTYFKLKSAYGKMIYARKIEEKSKLDSSTLEPTFTRCANWKKRAPIDFIFYNENLLVVSKLLQLVDENDPRLVGGLPSPHFSSDHIALGASFRLMRSTGEIGESSRRR